MDEGGVPFTIKFAPTGPAMWSKETSKLKESHGHIERKGQYHALISLAPPQCPEATFG